MIRFFVAAKKEFDVNGKESSFVFMRVQTVINCRPEFALPARYTIAMLGLVAGFRPRFIDARDADPSAPLLLYGDSTGISSGALVHIPEAGERETVFDGKRLYPPEMVSEVQIGPRTLLGFFLRSEPPGAAESPEGFSFPLDLVAAAFYFLSLHEEAVVLERDQFDRFESRHTLRGKLAMMQRPVVAEYGLALGEMLRACGLPLDPDNRYGGKASAICVTHDIDYLSKWSPGIAYREFVSHFLLNRLKQPPPNRIDRLLDFLKALSPSRDPYKFSLVKMMEKEQEAGICSTWFFKAGGNDKRDMQYALRGSFLRRAFEALARDGHEIGFHPSFNTYRDGAMWRKEREALERAAGRSAACVRQHYLRFSRPETWRIMEENGIAYDSTLGFAEMNGFRNGTCHPFLPFDIEAGRVMRFWEVPLHLMDGTLQSYRGMTPGESAEEIDRSARIVAEHHGVFTILFHNTCYDRHEFPGWSGVYEAFLASCPGRDAAVSTIPDVVETWIRGAAYKDLQDLLETIGS